MSSLFRIEEQAAPAIPGLSYIPDYITREEENALVANIDVQPWLTDLKRRVQHYGYKYDYETRAVTNESYLGPLPDWLAPLARKLQSDGLFPAMPDQAIVNEYLPGQGISPHVDCIPCFGAVIASLSLASRAIMQFRNPVIPAKREIYLQERGLIVLTGPARYEWLHAIPGRKSDVVGGIRIERQRRLSLTFRTVILEKE